MSRSELQRLLGDLRSVADLGEEFERLAGDTDAQVRWANARGYGFSREDVAGAVDSSGELSDDELEEAAGGWTGDPVTGDPGGTPPPTS